MLAFAANSPPANEFHILLLGWRIDEIEKQVCVCVTKTKCQRDV